MNLNDNLSEVNHITNLLNYFVSNNDESKDIKCKYENMMKILSNEKLENIIIFFKKNNHMLEYINFYYGMCTYPIHYLFQNRNLDTNMIDLLIFYKAKLHYENEEISIINILLRNVNLNNNKVFEILKYLKENNYDFNKCGNNMTIFHYLGDSQYVDIDILNLFSDYDINKRNNMEETPLMNAVRENNIVLIDYLLNREDCDISILNNNNNTPLMYAAMNNNIKAISLLIKRGCDVNYRDNQGDMPLFYACGCDNKGKPELNIIKYLVINGCDINSISNNGQTALHYASGAAPGCDNSPNLEIINYLIKIGVDLNKLDFRKYTFFDYLLWYYNINYLYEKLLKNISLGAEIMNSLIINNVNLKKLVIKRINVKSKEELICGISRCPIEKNDCYFKCKFDHYFEKDLLFEWYKKSTKYACPLCFGVIDLSKEYQKV